MYNAQATAPEDEEAVEMQGLPVPHGPDQRGAETRGRQGGSPLNGSSGACVSGRVEPTAHGDPRGVDGAKRQLCKGRGEKPFVSRIPERALGSRKADDGEIVTDDLARVVGRSDMQQKLQADVQAPRFGNRGPIFPGKSGPSLCSEGKGKVIRGQRPKKGTCASHATKSRRAIASTAVKGD